MYVEIPKQSDPEDVFRRRLCQTLARLSAGADNFTVAADGTYNFDAASGKVSSITIRNGRITAIVVAP